ncbi:MAG: GLPGLI family protein [Cytophagales bacterium]|nr:GLPGLI family protein [Cytophagales bacterium]
MRKITLLLFAIICYGAGFAQFKGEATYKTAASMNVDFDGDMPGVDAEAIRKQIAQQMQREYTLTFNTHESSYKRVEELDQNTSVSGGGVQIRMTGGEGITYRNTKTKVHKESEDLFGKEFLIVDEPETRDWKILNDFKQIGQYECQKAVFESTTRQMTVDSDNGNEVVEKIDTIQVVAWFAPSIPVSHGPDSYWGLPGLILEVKNGNFSILCTKVVMNSDEIGEIEIPKKGKKISRTDFDELREEKLSEMMNQYQGEGNRTMIRIGG